MGQSSAANIIYPHTQSPTQFQFVIPFSLRFLFMNHELEEETDGVKVISGSVCKVRTQDTDNFDEEVKPLASAR